ncbi:MAG: hypothetical protein LBR69_07865 [Endomicrobium sp.]|jgi:Spy/CpxP family protein refolding chaperone|nr:hypothetical protein [Endomicrobium sp.]
MNRIKTYFAACFFVLTVCSFSFAQENADLNALKQAMSEQAKIIKERANSMTAQEKQEFNRQMKQSMAEQKEKMKEMLEGLTPKQKAEFEKVISDSLKEFELK